MPIEVSIVHLALQGGGSNGAFTWGVLDRLLQELWLRQLRHLDDPSTFRRYRSASRGEAAIEIVLKGQVRIAAACKSSFRPIPLMVVSKEGPVARGVPYQCSYMI